MSWDLQRKLDREAGSKGADAEHDDDVDSKQERARARRVSRALLDAERARIQRRNNGHAPSASPHEAAAAGIASPTTAMPHAERIQASFGPDHDVSKIHAHVGDESAAVMGAKAYATGSHVVFDNEPDLHTAAHEAAHVVQQANGIKLKGGIGQAGDEFEQNADAVADRVVAGRSAADLLGPRAPGISTTGSIQLKSTMTGQEHEIEMPEDYVGKPDIEMPPDYVGSHEPGEQYKTQGPVCERPGAVGMCDLETGYRHRLIDDLNSYVPTAITSYQTALQNARIDELLKKAPQLGLVAELLLGAVGVIAGTLLNGAAAAAIKELNQRAVLKNALNPEQLDGAVAAQSTHMRSVIAEVNGIAKGRAKLAFTGNSPQSQLKEAFLRKLQNEVAPTLHSLRGRMLDAGDDLALAVITKLFAPNRFTVEACAAHVSGLVDRLEQQNLDEIGEFKDAPVPGTGETAVVQLQSFGQHRLAVVKFFHRKHLGTSYGADWYTKEGEEFLNWVDDDFGEFATSAQETRNGAMKTIDVSLFPNRFGPEVSSWVERTRKGNPR